MTLAPAVPAALAALPASGSTSWYSHYQGLDARARTAIPRVLTPEQYGAVGDGVTDDQAALQRMLDDAKEGEHLLLAASYRHSNVLRLPVPRLRWTQLGRLIASDSTRAAVQVSSEAYGAVLTGVWNETDWGSTAMVRGGTDILTAGLAVWDTHSITVDGLTSRFSRQTGMYCSTVKRSRFRDLNVFRSMADSVHFTHNCEDIDIERVRVSYSGDDALAVVSYLTRGTGGAAVDPCRRIRARGLVARYSHARGATILGGEDITFTDLDIAWTRAAGCYMGSESGYNTHVPVRCVMRNGKVADVGFPIPPSGSTTDDGALDHGHLFLLSQQSTPVTDCWFEDFEVSGGGDPVFGFNREVVSGNASNPNAFVRSGWRRVRATIGRERRAGGISLYGPHDLNANGLARERMIDQRPPASSLTPPGASLGQAVSARLASNVSAPSGTATVLSWTGNDAVDTNDLHSTTSNPQRLVAKVAGAYKVEAFISFNTVNGGFRHVFIQINGTTSVVDEIRPANTGFATRMATGTVVQLAVGDYVTVGVYHEAGSAVPIEANLSSFSMYGVG